MIPFLGGLVAIFFALYLIWFFGVDRDPGGYADGFREFLPGYVRPPYDKLFHTLGGAIVALLALLIGNAPLMAFFLAMLAGTGLEWVQKHPYVPFKDGTKGHFSVMDLMADAIGAGLMCVIWATL